MSPRWRFDCVTDWLKRLKLLASHGNNNGNTVEPPPWRHELIDLFVEARL